MLVISNSGTNMGVGIVPAFAVCHVIIEALLGILMAQLIDVFFFDLLLQF